MRVAIAAVAGRPAREITTHTSLQGDLGFDSLMLTELLDALEARGRVIDPSALQACHSVEDVERLVRAPRTRSSSAKHEVARERSRVASEKASTICACRRKSRKPRSASSASSQDAFYGK